MAKGWRKNPADWDQPLEVEVLTTAGPQPWHEECLRLRAEGMTIRAVAAELGLTFSRVQKFLNPASKAKNKARQAARAKERRHSDPDYAEKQRSYVRRYMQLASGGRNKE